MQSLHVHPNCYKKNLLFFIKYKNEWKERKFSRQKNEKVTFTITKK